MENELNKLFRMYTDECEFSRRLRPETVRGYKAVFSLFLKVMPEVSSTRSLTPETLNEFFKRIQTRKRIVGKDTIKTGVKNSTVKTHWTKLNVFFAWLVKKGYLLENPLKDIRPPVVRYDDFKRLSDAELSKIYSAVTLQSSNSLLQRRDTLMISLLVFLGVRKGEFISLKVHDIDLVKEQITIRGETSKSKRPRTLCLTPSLLLHIKDYLKERNSRGLKTDQLIVSNRGDRGLSRQGLKHWVENLRKKSGVRFHLHQFRHTFACKLAEANVNAFNIQKMMGHANISMTMKYVRSMQTEDMGRDICKISIY